MEERIRRRIFEATRKISNQNTIDGPGYEETIDIVIEVATKPSPFERLALLFVVEYLDGTRGEKNILECG